MTSENLLQVVKDKNILEDDEATYVKVLNSDFHDGVIEVDVLSRFVCYQMLKNMRVVLLVLLLEFQKMIQVLSHSIFDQQMVEQILSYDVTEQHNIFPIQILGIFTPEKRIQESMSHMLIWF